MKHIVFASLTVLLLSGALSAQTVLKPSASHPVIDGSIGVDEYQFSTEVSGMKVGATLGDDGKLYLSISAKTAGWVALGVGGQRMDGSRLFLAYDTGAKQAFNEQRGVGHGHTDVSDTIVEKWAVKNADGVTSLELVLPSSAAIADGKLDLLFAYSNSTSYFTHHAARGSLSLSVSN
jgi:hypothetical protein